MLRLTNSGISLGNLHTRESPFYYCLATIFEMSTIFCKKWQLFPTTWQNLNWCWLICPVIWSSFVHISETSSSNVWAPRLLKCLEKQENIWSMSLCVWPSIRNDSLIYISTSNNSTCILLSFYRQWHILNIIFHNYLSKYPIFTRILKNASTYLFLHSR